MKISGASHWDWILDSQEIANSYNQGGAYGRPFLPRKELRRSKRAIDPGESFSFWIQGAYEKGSHHIFGTGSEEGTYVYDILRYKAKRYADKLQ